MNRKRVNEQGEQLGAGDAGLRLLFIPESGGRRACPRALGQPAAERLGVRPS